MDQLIDPTVKKRKALMGDIGANADNDLKIRREAETDMNKKDDDTDDNEVHDTGKLEYFTE